MCKEGCLFQNMRSVLATVQSDAAPVLLFTYFFLRQCGTSTQIFYNTHLFKNCYLVISVTALFFGQSNNCCVNRFI